MVVKERLKPGEARFADSRAAIGAIINGAAIDQSISHLHFQLLATVK